MSVCQFHFCFGLSSPATSWNEVVEGEMFNNNIDNETVTLQPLRIYTVKTHLKQNTFQN